MTVVLPRGRVIMVETVAVTMIEEVAVTRIVGTATAVATPREHPLHSHHTVAVNRLLRLQGTALAMAAVVVATVIAVAVVVAKAVAAMVVTGIPVVMLVDMVGRLLCPRHLAGVAAATMPHQRRQLRPTVAAAHMVAPRNAATRHHPICLPQRPPGWKAEGLLPHVAPTPVMVGIAVEVKGGDCVAPRICRHTFRCAFE